MTDTDPVEELLAIERAREARRQRRNRWLIALAVVAVLAAVYVVWGVTSMQADRERHEDRIRIGQLYEGSTG